MVSHPTENVYTFSKVQRIPCPVHNGKDKNVSLGAGWAVCHSRGCSSKDILAALNLTPAIRWTPPPRRAASVAPLPAVSAAEGLDYLERIRSLKGRPSPINAMTGSAGSIGATLTSGATLASLATAGRHAGSIRMTRPAPPPFA